MKITELIRKVEGVKMSEKQIKRYIYKKNPLVEVILQLRFPKILSLNSIEPAEYQDKIRSQFPIYQLQVEQENQVMIQNDGKTVIPSVVNSAANKNHNFISDDGFWKINLTSSYISISTLKYTRWEELLEKFENPYKQFVELYKPSFFERIGLRYVDAFNKKNLNLDNKPWKDLIKEHLLGSLSIEDESKIKSFSMNEEYRLEEENCFMRIQTGLGSVNQSKEVSFILDCDLYKLGKTMIDDVEEVEKILHDNSTKFIQNAIKQELHTAMEPEDL